MDGVSGSLVIGSESGEGIGRLERTVSIPFCEFRLPYDVLKKIFKLLDLPSLMAAQCVCKEWCTVASDHSIWRKIRVPRHLACRLWDQNFATMVKKCQGELLELQVSGSGITGKSMLSLLNATDKTHVIQRLNFDQCSNLTGGEILNFLKTRSAILKTDVNVQRLSIDGCSSIGSVPMTELHKHVDHVDVDACICSRVEILKKCGEATCKGLCSFCREFFEHSSIECGLCSEPLNALQLLRIRFHRWSLRIPDNREYWIDVRHGLTDSATESNLIRETLMV